VVTGSLQYFSQTASVVYV